MKGTCYHRKGIVANSYSLTPNIRMSVGELAHGAGFRGALAKSEGIFALSEAIEDLPASGTLS